MPTFGIEEEVFLLEPDRPGLGSLASLAQLLWQDPRLNYRHTAVNLAHLLDIPTGLMAGIEISTPIAPSAAAAVRMLRERREELAGVTEGLIIPIGALLEDRSRSRTCALHIHIGGVPLSTRIYHNLARFLPLLCLLTANSPCIKGEYFGKSCRIYHSPFIGPLVDDPWYRFQDIIFSKRLRTIELRIFDPVWDLERIRALLGAIEAILSLREDLGVDREWYGSSRREASLRGYNGFLDGCMQELQGIHPLPERLFRETPSDEVRALYLDKGLVPTYTALDNAYRHQILEPHRRKARAPGLGKVCQGIVGYYLPKLPYNVWKTWRELA